MLLKKNEVQIGGVYIAKVTNRLVQVRIEKVSRYGGWEAINLATNKPIRVKSAQRLRSVVDSAQTMTKKGKGREKPEPVPDSDTVQTVNPRGEPEATPETAAPACPNCGGTEVDENGDCAKCHEPKDAGKEVNAKKLRAKKAKADKPKRISGLDAAAKVLEETGVAMNVKEIVEVAFAKGYWKPAGRTPSATLAAALMREIAKKGDASRFRKSERGKFVLNR